MALTPATRLGVYEITAQIGVGGMGEVYRATDTKLKRQVAIKILPSSLAADPDRLARFQREAEVLASLNHPHIAAIYGLEDADGVRALVMELVEGDDLSQRIELGPIPLDEALPIAKEIAEALEAAHEQGIIHRDLKPGNIMLTAEGQVKVLDFGLAKLESGSSGPSGRGGELTNSPTLAPTQPGMILGTAAYMAPEQAKGRAADKRSDIWAFGCVLYELLTGRRAFEGEDVGDTLAAILRGEPDWKALPHGVPGNIHTILRGCLEKDRHKRLADMSVVQFLLTDGARIGAPIDGPSGGLERRPSGMRVAAIAAGSAIVAGIATAAITLTLIRSEPIVTRLDVVTPPTDDPISFALSPDGRQLVFVASVENTSRLWVRPLDQTTAQPLPGTDGASYPFWSPDGRALGFFADGKLKRLDVGGGVPQVLADAPSGRGGSWSRDGSIVFAPRVSGPLLRVSASGGPVAVLYAPDQSVARGYRWPQLLPDGRRILFWSGGSGSESPGVYLAQLDGSGIRRIMSANSAAAYAPGAYLLVVDQGTLLAHAFDVERAEVGDPVAVAPSVAEDQSAYRGGFSVSATGVLAHRAAVAVRRQLVWVDRRGMRVGTIGPPDENGLINPALAPDGRRVVVQRSNQGQPSLWMLDSTRSVAAPFTFTSFVAPIWSPDGSRVLFASRQNLDVDLYEKAASGGGTEHLVFSSADAKLPTDWSADGRLVLYQSVNEKTGSDLWALPLVGDRKPFPVVQTSFDDRNGELAPDGRWIAYESNQSGRFEVYVQRFPAPSGKWQISTGGGVTPRWSHDGREVFYLAPDGALMAVRVSLTSDGQALQPGTPARLFRMSIVPAVGNKHQYAVSPDNQRFLMNVRTDDAIASPITIVQNWLKP